MLKHLEIAPDALEVGYILDEDVYENRVLLIRKGQVVTDHIKELLQTLTERQKEIISKFLPQTPLPILLER